MLGFEACVLRGRSGRNRKRLCRQRGTRFGQGKRPADAASICLNWIARTYRLEPLDRRKAAEAWARTARRSADVIGRGPWLWTFQIPISTKPSTIAASDLNIACEV